MINSDKYEMRPLLARTTFPSVNSSPPAVAARADHIFKPDKTTKNVIMSHMIILYHIIPSYNTMKVMTMMIYGDYIYG